MFTVTYRKRGTGSYWANIRTDEGAAIAKVWKLDPHQVVSGTAWAASSRGVKVTRETRATAVAALVTTLRDNGIRI